MSPQADVLVVGAGPAGAAVATYLARAGRRVLVVDRSGFPRDKACGGGLTPRGVAALDRLGVDTAAAWTVRVDGLELIGAGRTARTSFPRTKTWPSFGLVARRSDLDAAILEQATKAGAVLRTALRATGPVVEDGVCRGVRLADRSEVRADVTIAADGATSAIARGAGLAPTPASGFWYAAMRSYLRGVSGERPVLAFYPLRDDAGRWLPGYGWTFPLPDGTVNVGVDLPHRPVLGRSTPLRDAYASFVRRLRRERVGYAEAVEEGLPAGALLPEGMRGIRPAMPGLLLLGDAAGLISPYSGEGIAYALESAELAVEALEAKRPHEAYTRALAERYGFQFRTAIAFMKAARRPALAGLGAAAGTSSPRALRAAVRVMAYLIEDDPGSSVCRAYNVARRVLPGR